MFRYVILLVMTGACTTHQRITSVSEIVETPNETFIEGFINTKPENDPWPQVGCLLKNTTETSCTGTLVSPNVVITAGHCVVWDSDEYYFEFLDGQVYKVDEVIRYPKNRLCHLYNDCALLVLEDNVVGIEPMNISPHNFLTKGYPLDVVGYSRGWKKHSDKDMFWYYGVLVGEEGYFKTLPYKSSVWFGDSGGPAIASFGDDTYIVGVISTLSIRDDYITENSFARVDVIYDWLDIIITTHSVCWVGNEQ
tara:strand:+ start:1676 stop:2428 length:753 start_codon:yes stop_codon:yes gene_type:complete